MDEYYQKCIEQAFIDPIRSVVIVDDDYPTAMEVLDARLGEIAGNAVKSQKSWITKPQPVKDVISEFRDGSRPFILDIHDAQTMTEDDEIEGAAHLHQTDLLILDYELDKDKAGDFSRSLKVAKRLMSNAHFNLIIVNTDNSLDVVFRNFLLGLLFPSCSPLSGEEEANVEAAYVQMENGENFEIQLGEAFGFSQYVGVWKDTKSAMRDLMRGAGPFAQAKVLFEAVKLERRYWKTLARSALVTYQSGCVKNGLMSEEDLNVESFSNEPEIKWIRSDKAFITFSHKPDGKPLLKCLQSALEDWKPKPSRLVLTKMLAEIDEHGVEMQGKALQDDYSSALWYEGILKAGDNQRKSKVDETVQRHVDGMLVRLIPEVQKFASDFANSENECETENAVLVQAHYGIDLADDKERKHAQLSHNAVVCSQEKHGWHILTGHIFELDGSLWVCVSPACDTGPEQNRTVKANRLRFNAIRLQKPMKDKLPDNVQSNGHIFLRSDDSVNVYPVSSAPNAMPELEVFYAENKGIFHGDMEVAVLRAEEIQPEPEDNETKVFALSKHDVQIVAHLRYEYALNLIHRLGSAQTRVGLDFSG